MKDFNINMSEFDLLDPNNYTEEKNPILSTLFHTFINDKLGNNSDEVKKMIATNSEQLELYNNAYWESISINAKVEAERFILGFKFALMLIKEGFKG